MLSAHLLYDLYQPGGIVMLFKQVQTLEAAHQEAIYGVRKKPMIIHLIFSSRKIRTAFLKMTN